MDLPFKFDDAAEGRNTRIDYLYRDADNYKENGFAILSGRMTAEQAAKVASRLYDGDYFIPGKVGLPDLQVMMPSDWDDEVDDPFHEIVSIRPTNADPDIDDLTVDQFVAAFESVPEDWDFEAYQREHLSPGD